MSKTLIIFILPFITQFFKKIFEKLNIQYPAELNYVLAVSLGIIVNIIFSLTQYDVAYVMLNIEEIIQIGIGMGVGATGLHAGYKSGTSLIKKKISN